ncbi:uncharacterized protein LOC141532215 isoform X2 [Cotesia typhae]|uniref:uncharacterized protein LOC141532215 isoform X2 n=1 Tax=Cotesia typhae TaxID=2053667 RepID=UPI003D695724
MIKSKLLFLFSVLIGVLTNSNVSIAMKITSSSYSSKNCSANRVRCDPNLPQPCCDSNNKCINTDRTKLDAETYICLKEAMLGDPCENWFDCEAIIEGKCAEDSTCACNKYSSEWNTIQYGEKCSDDDQCAELGDRGLICANFLEGSSECKCPEWMQFDVESGYCTEDTELVDLNDDPNPNLFDVEMLNDREFNVNGETEPQEYP